jgi:hypothetical protein
MTEGKMELREQILEMAKAKICPLNMSPTTPYEIHAVQNLVNFGLSVIALVDGQGYVRLYEDQSLPKIIIPKHSRGIGCPHCGEEFGIEDIAATEQIEAQRDMLSANFRRVKPC